MFLINRTGPFNRVLIAISNINVVSKPENIIVGDPPASQIKGLNYAAFIAGKNLLIAPRIVGSTFPISNELIPYASLCKSAF